jgi:hypothetical protein
VITCSALCDGKQAVNGDGKQAVNGITAEIPKPRFEGMQSATVPPARRVVVMGG